MEEIMKKCLWKVWCYFLAFLCSVLGVSCLLVILAFLSPILIFAIPIFVLEDMDRGLSDEDVSC